MRTTAEQRQKLRQRTHERDAMRAALDDLDEAVEIIGYVERYFGDQLTTTAADAGQEIHRRARAFMERDE